MIILPVNPGGNGGVLLLGEVERVKNLYLVPVITAMFESPYIFQTASSYQCGKKIMQAASYTNLYK